ncbi:hypothetical protein ACFQX8_19055 [Klenkia terrae]|uniref:hypothetical protein n=1 Tax=Klenkia terrae TaxID=1052259 RepID=UPI0036228AC6
MRYLYGSRRSWRLAAAGRRGHDVVGDLWIPDDFRAEELTPRELLHLLDLTPDEALTAGPAPQLIDPAVDRPMGADGWAELRERLRGGPVGVEATRRAEERAELLLAYLDQEGVTGPGRVGIVDVGWTGRATRSLEDLLEASGRALPAAYLFIGLLGPAERRLGPELFGRCSAWLVDAARGLQDRSLPGEDPVMLVESMAMGRQGTTTGFAREGDRVVPVLAAPVNPVASGWGFEDYRRALDLAVDAFIDSGPGGHQVDLRPTVWAQLLDLWRRPTPRRRLRGGAALRRGLRQPAVVPARPADHRAAAAARGRVGPGGLAAAAVLAQRLGPVELSARALGSAAARCGGPGPAGPGTPPGAAGVAAAPAPPTCA